MMTSQRYATTYDIPPAVDAEITGAFLLALRCLLHILFALITLLVFVFSVAIVGMVLTKNLTRQLVAVVYGIAQRWEAQKGGRIL
jgi:hypothetical protein